MMSVTPKDPRAPKIRITSRDGLVETAFDYVPPVKEDDIDLLARQMEIFRRFKK